MFEEAHIIRVMDLLLSRWLNGTADWIDLAIAVQLACGPRVGEVTYHANLEEVQDKENYIKQVLLLFNFVFNLLLRNFVCKIGNLKVKDRPIFEKPVNHYSVQQLLSMFRSMREMLLQKKRETKTEKIENFTRKLTSYMNKRLRELWPQDIPPVTTNTVRKMWVLFMWQKHGILIGTQSQSAYYDDVLGHSLTSSSSTAHYYTDIGFF